MKIEREIKVDHLARIEGKAGVIVEIGKDIKAKIKVTEGPRFFELITKGKKYDDAVAICPRICSFCSIPHKLTPIEAVENALGIETSEQTKLLRNILYFANMVESHALHLYLFAIPDYLGYPDAFSMAKEHLELVKNGLELKDFGVKVQSIIGSREIHPENAIVGGFGKIPSKNEMEKVKEMAKEVIKRAVATVDFFAEYEYPSYIDYERNHLSIKPYDGYGVYGNEIVASDGFSFNVSYYKENIKEEVVPYSFAKRGKYKDKPFMVGAISRLTNNHALLDGEAKELLNNYREFLNPSNCFANNFAQAIEMVYFIEKIAELAENYEGKDESKAKAEKKSGRGYAVTEAPRGLLIYEVEIENEIVKYMNVITPTAMFLPMMEVDVVNMAKGMWENGYKDIDLIGKKVEMVIRAYDPCISCSVHVIKI
ncbi:MAG TPA: Ni/Fe hydrogenase subunit alpha [Thermoplasmatales archaeon]|nr:Ni/Fe hydrogenase subunit alpha [Thermoplasmatales archaeon]